VDSAWKQNAKRLEASSLSKYDPCILNPLTNFNLYLGIAKQSEGRVGPVHIILVLVQDAVLGGGL
jgi:hypothetical protein